MASEALAPRQVAFENAHKEDHVITGVTRVVVVMDWHAKPNQAIIGISENAERQPSKDSEGELQFATTCAARGDLLSDFFRDKHIHIHADTA